MEATVDKFGRVIIPKELRTALDLRPGTVVDLVATAEALVLKPVQGESNLKMQDGVLVYTGRADTDLKEAVNRHREEQIDVAVGRAWK